MDAQWQYGLLWLQGGGREAMGDDLWQPLAFYVLLCPDRLFPE